MWVYILYSEEIDRYYTGHSQDLEDRLSRHNTGKSKATKNGVPWELKWSYECESRSEAMKLENWIKKMKSRVFIEKVIDGKIDLTDKPYM